MKKSNFRIPANLYQPGLINRAYQLLTIICIFIGFSGTVNYLDAQVAPHPSFRQYTTDDGLASSEVYYILQDREGFIWISTDNGVSRFDGYEFRNYGVKDGLLENVIFMMQLDTMGRLWMQAMSGNLYFLEDNKIKPYWNNTIISNYKSRATGKGFIVEGAGETIHIATLKYGVISIKRDGAVTEHLHQEAIYRQVFVPIDSILEKKGLAINAYSEQGNPELLKTYQDSLAQLKLNAPLYIYAKDTIWSFRELTYSKIVGQATEVFYLGNGKYIFQMFHDLWFIENGAIQWKVYFPHHILHARLMDNGELMIGLHFHKGLKVFKSIAAFQQNEGSTWLPGESVSYFMEDKDGGKWVATNENGVFYMPAEAFRVHDRETGLSDDKVTAITIKNDNELYVGLGNGSVWKLQRDMGIWEALPPLSGIGNVRDIHFAPQTKQLWAGRNKLYYLQQNKWILCEADYPGGRISMGNRITTSPDEKHLWVCNHFGFLNIEATEHDITGQNLGYDQRTYIVKEDFSGAVWVGQPSGLFEWKEGVLQERRSLHPALSLRVEDIAQMQDSTLIIATKGGGLVFWKNNNFEQITTEDGLTADMMECIYTDDKGLVWAGTLNGLNRISGYWGNRQVEQITTFHGLPSNEINRISSFGDNVWVATNNGLVRFSYYKNSRLSPKPILTTVLSNNTPVNHSAPVSLPASQNNLTINFFALNYKMNGKIPYRYKMDKGDWGYTFNRSLNFPALPTGQCTFQVQAQNEDGIWSETTFFTFVINPPWWDTWWARITALIMGLSFVLVVYKYRTGELKRKNKIQLQIADLERAALQAQMNPHFIFNCLNSIQNYILQNEKESAIMYLGSFASLVRSMLNASVAGKILLVEEVKLLNNYLQLEQMRFKNRFTYQVITAEGLDAFDIKIPPLLVQPYVENALIHGMFGKKSGGEVRVSFDKKESYLEVSIQDNGKGFKEADPTKENKNEHKSFGMSITKNRLELLSNNKENKHVRYKSLLNKKGQMVGTLVTIRIEIEEDI